MRRSAMILLLLAALSCRSTPEPEPPPPAVREVATDPPLRIDFSRRGDAGAREVAGGAPSGVAPEAFCGLYGRVICRKLFACVEPEALAVDAGDVGFGDEATCTTRLEDGCRGFLLAGVESSVAEGRVRWDAAGFGRCASDWIAQGCSGPLGDLPDVPVCRQSSVGLVATGGRCTTAFDCADQPGRQVVCAFSAVGEGVCEVYKEDGEPCVVERGECRPGLVCRGDQCQAPGQRGERCGFHEDCAEGLRCEGEVCLAAP
jgi:hypothetical protein